MRLTTFGYLLVLLSSSLGKDLPCNSTQNVEPNEVYNISNPGYPQNYTPGASCRWTVICPTGYNCQLNCSEINLPETPSCSMDRLLISKTGDLSLSGAEHYCGQRTLNVTSTGQRLSLGLISSDQNPGGRFYCQVNAQLAAVTSAPCRCGYKKLNRIIGGQDTETNEFPMMAGLVYIQAILKCGAVIISKRHVMTTAQCVADKDIPNYAVVVGGHEIIDFVIDDSPVIQNIQVKNITIHPLYYTTTLDYDISILTLQRDIVFSDRVGPVCLPFKFVNFNFTGSPVTILGWGRVTADGPPSQVLQKADVNVISQSECRRQFLVSRRQICTFTPSKSATRGDGGGPLLYTDPSNGLLYSVGIISYGAAVGFTSPTINTRVTEFLDWIVGVTGENFCKL